MNDKSKHYKSEAFAAIHQTAEGLHGIGAIDKRTMQDFDMECLVEIMRILPEDIKKIQE